MQQGFPYPVCVSVCVRACVCMCVCISPHYTHCVDLSRRVTPEARSPALLGSDALNYTTLGLIAELQVEHTGSEAFRPEFTAVILTEIPDTNVT